MKKFIFLFMLCALFSFANTLDEIRQSGVLKVGIYTAQPPFSNYDGSKFEGFEIDLAKAIADKIFINQKANIEFTILNPDDRIPFLKDNKVDFVVANFSITDERSKEIDFSMPYFAVNIGILTNKSDNIASIKDVNNKTVLCGKSSTADLYFASKGYKIEYCNTATQCYKLLKSANNYVYAADNIIVLAFSVVDQSLEVNIKNIGQTDFLGIGVQKGNKELLDFINQQMVNLSKENFFKKAFENTINPFYKGKAEKKYFLLDDIYSMF